MTVTIIPMPDEYRKIPKKFRPQHPPVFTDCGESGPSQEDIELARELFGILDDESKTWYGRRGIFKDLIKSKNQTKSRMRRKDKS